MAEQPRKDKTEASQDFTSWIRMRNHTWRELQNNTHMKKRSEKLQWRQWLFSNSILKGVGKEIHFLTARYVLQGHVGSAWVRRTRDVLKECPQEIKLDNLNCSCLGWRQWTEGRREAKNSWDTYRRKYKVQMVQLIVREKVFIMSVLRRKVKEQMGNKKLRFAFLNTRRLNDVKWRILLKEGEFNEVSRGKYHL